MILQYFINMNKNNNIPLKLNKAYDIINTVAKECRAFVCRQKSAVSIRMPSGTWGAYKNLNFYERGIFNYG